MRWLSLCLGLALLAGATPLLAQRPVTLVTEGEAHPAVAALQEILARRNYLIIERDTVLGREFTTPGDILILQGDVRIAGRVGGAIGVVRGSVFLRPGAHVGGPVVVLDGEAYRSALAGEVEIIEAPIAARASVVGDDGGYVVTVVLPETERRMVRMPGAFGFGLPTYDRVNGLSLRWTTALTPTGVETGPSLRGSVVFRSARVALEGGFGADVPLGSGMLLRATAERTTLTNEIWYRSDLTNTLGALFFGSDQRDYYGSDRALVFIERPHQRALIAGEHSFAPRAGVQLSRDRSLPAASPRVVWRRDDGWRPNPEIDDGTIVSAFAGGQYRWRGRNSAAALDVLVEHAPGDAGDHAFTQALASLGWTMATFLEQSLSVDGFARATLDDVPAPRQRWNTLGGSATLPTLAVGALRGDQVVWVHSVYSAPIAVLRLGLLGPPSLQLAHAAGTAYATGAPRQPWIQNLGAGVGTRIAFARLYIDPEAPRESATVVIGLGF
jgi:hypothetical protein